MKSIKLDNQTYVHVFVHEVPLSLEEAILISEELPENKYEQQAKDLIDALEGHECVAFLEALHKVSAQRIVKHWRKYAPERLEEAQYKKYLSYE